jgi:hypothetical protein
MENKDIKKIVATIIASGGIVAGGFAISDKLNCDYAVQYKGEEICFTQEEKEFIENSLRPNAGFGGVRFNQK